jgi:hypothetical protein
MMVMKCPGFTSANYETIRKSINREGDVPSGALFHVAAFDNNGGYVTDIWESEQDFNQFVQSRLMPGTMAAGIKGEPQIEIIPLYAVFVPSLKP